MKTKNILRTFLAAVFVLGTMAMNAQTKIYVHKSDGTATEYNIADLDSISFNPPESIANTDYTKLILNEICGENLFVEIYNSGDVEIPMQGVKLQRNGGESEWTGRVGDVIPAQAYRLILFRNGNIDSGDAPASTLQENPAFTGWTISSGLSNQQTLKIAIIDPQGNDVDVFVRGNSFTGPWGTAGQTRPGRIVGVKVSNVTGDNDTRPSYSRMNDSTWAWAEPTPGAENESKLEEIVSDGYLTAP
jgi:hypothetical protein